MRAVRRLCLCLILVAASLSTPVPSRAEQPGAETVAVLQTWYKLILELVRHTPTYSPPVASRSFAYLGVTSYEAVASGSDDLQTLAGQLNGLTALPPRQSGLVYDDAVVMNAALSVAAQHFFGNTGPTGQRAMTALARQQTERITQDQPADVVERSAAFGAAIAGHVIGWSSDDGGAEVENLGFPQDYPPDDAKGGWVPTSKIALQQTPLLPDWGKNRPFAMPAGTTCALPAPPEYSEDPQSEFYLQAMEVVETTGSLSPDQIATARFWSDDPMLSPTPPGHWVSIALQVLAGTDSANAEQHVEVLARLGIAVADAFIGCWQTKYEYDLLRPVTYIRRTIDPKWEPLLITPPFPEYPSGHSSQSAAAAAVLSAAFGDSFTFSDETHIDDGLAPRTYPGFWAAAEEAAVSRLYGGIHFRAAIDRGLDQGKCVGAYAVALKTRQ